MRRSCAGWATCALLTLALAGGANAQSKKRSDKPEPPAASKHYDFEDDKVEGDVQRADDPIVESRDRARFGLLIKPRSNFIPELLRSADRL